MTESESREQPEEIRITRVLPAPVEQVFAAWTEPERMRHWMSPFGPATASVDLRIGGRFELVMHGPEMSVSHSGTYTEIQPPHRLVFTWASEYTGGRATLVAVSLRPSGDGGTELQLVHSKLPESQVEPHRGGWGMLLERLAALLSDSTTLER
jgi:uncharacterized protein YndB with AHSA1/START domain